MAALKLKIPAGQAGAAEAALDIAEAQIIPQGQERLVKDMVAAQGLEERATNMMAEAEAGQEP
jgi:hypothetical protein